MRRATVRRLGLTILPLLAALFFPGLVPDGLGQDWMTPHYDTYSSFSTDGTYIYTSVTLDGSTSGSCPSFPAQLANECHNSTHTPKVYNVVGSTGGWESGNAVYWANYLTLTNSQTLAATQGTEYLFSWTGQVMCSFAGAVYYLSGDVYLSIAVTTVETVCDFGFGDCKVQADCTGGGTPRCPIGTVEDGDPCAPGFICLSLAYRLSQSSPYSCLPAAICNETSTLPGPCDKSP